MTAQTRYELRAAEYRTRAEADAQAGAAAVLDTVRDKFEQAARRWTELADAEELRAAQSRVYRGKESASGDPELAADPIS
jgi:hypothetical protein